MAFPGLWAAAGETPHLFIDACKVSKTLEQLHFSGCVGGSACPGSMLGWGHCCFDDTAGQRSLHSPYDSDTGGLGKEQVPPLTHHPSQVDAAAVEKFLSPSWNVLCSGRISLLLADHTGWVCRGLRRCSLSQASSGTGSPRRWPGS